MDDIVWIREDDSIPASDQPPTGDAPSTTASKPDEEEPETFIEIPVVFQPKSTEVRYYPTEESKNEEREGDVPVEIYNPFSASTPSSNAVPNGAPASNDTQSGQKNGGGNAIVISLLFRGQDNGNGASRKEPSEPLPAAEQKVAFHTDTESRKDQPETPKTAQPATNEETNKPGQASAAAEPAVISLVYKDPAKNEETKKPSEPPTAAEPAVISLVYKDPATKEDTNKPSQPPTAAEPAVISLVYKDPSKKAEPPKEQPPQEDAPVKVEVFNPPNRGDVPVSVEVFNPPNQSNEKGNDSVATKADEEPVIIDHNTPEILEEAAQKLQQLQKEESKPTEAVAVNEVPVVTVSAPKIDNEQQQQQKLEEPAAKTIEANEILPKPDDKPQEPILPKPEEKPLQLVTETNEIAPKPDEKPQEPISPKAEEKPQEPVVPKTENKPEEPIPPKVEEKHQEPAVPKTENKPQQPSQNAVDSRPPVSDEKPAIIFEDIHKTIEDIDQLPPPPELPTGGLARNVESVIIGEGIVKYVTGSLVLPNGTVLVTDEEEGIIVFDTQGNVVKKIKNPSWRKPRSPIYHKEHVLMLVDIEEGQSNWCRYIFKFTVDLQYVAKIEGPKWMRDETVISERLSIAHTDYMYLCVCGEIFSSLYELTPVGQWTELQYRLSESYTDMLAFAVVGPITQVLVVEGNKNYVLMFSVRDSEVVDRRRIALCQRPGALARDEAGRLFVANRAAAAIQLVDTVRWVSARNVALADAMVPHFSASWGLLAIPLKGAIRLHRYSFRFGVNK